MVYTDTGRNILRDFLHNDNPSTPLGIAFGTNTTTATVTDTTLGAEIAPRIEFTASSLTDKEVKFEGVLPTTTGNGNTITELGLFTTTSATSGDMFLRQVFAGIDKTTGNDITAEVTLRFTGID
jgi:hypothetical protein